MNPYIRVIGDVHGKLAPRPKRRERNVRDLFPTSPYHVAGDARRNYLSLIKQTTYSIQLGDMGLAYDPLAGVDPAFHFAIAGNHDNIPNLTKHFLGDSGVHSIPMDGGSFDFFFVRGARSVDIEWRTEGVNWWPDEELSESQMLEARYQYQAVLPNLVLSHDCPAEIVPLVATMTVKEKPSRTNTLLQSLLDIHPPAMWIFGHHHRSWAFQHPSGTTFVCVGALGYFDFDKVGKPVFDIPR